MIEESITRYRIYEYIRDNEKITVDMSKTKRLIVKLMQKDKKTEEFCNKKIKEEKMEVEEAKLGQHFHRKMTKREILVNEISQYIYWLTIVSVSKNITYEEFDIESKINEILEHIDVTKIGETTEITLEEIVKHDLEEMNKKQYLKEVVNK